MSNKVIHPGNFSFLYFPAIAYTETLVQMLVFLQVLLWFSLFTGTLTLTNFSASFYHLLYFTVNICSFDLNV